MIDISKLNKAKQDVIASMVLLAEKMDKFPDYGTGALHIWLADGNCEDEHLEFCRWQAGPITPDEIELIEWALLNTSEGARGGAWAIYSAYPR